MARKNVGKGFFASPGKHHKTRSGSGNKEAEQRERKTIIKNSTNEDIRRIIAYEDILGKGQVNPNLDLSVLNENRAQNQSGWYLTKNAFGQLGTTILGGTITGIGSILNFFPTTYRAISQIWDDNAKYKWDKAINEGLGSEWQRVGKDIENWGRKAMPIYQTEQAQKGGFAGGMGDATWWASMFPTVGSAAASMLPVIGQMRALQAVGK